MHKKRRPQRKIPPNRPASAEVMATNPEFQAAIFAVIDKQLAQNNPPETRQTLERLVGMGHTREGARQLIATAVASEIFAVMQAGQPYDAARFLAALARLPAL